MRKTNLLKVTIATLALSMIVAAPMATFNVSANDGKGIYAEKNATITDLDRDAIVTASSANVREGISTAYRVLNVFEKGTKFHIDGVACKDGEQTNWYRVIVTDKQYGGECAGYINKSTFEFTDGQDEDLRDLFDTIYSAQPGTAGGSEKTSEAAEEFRAFVFDRDEEVTEGEIAYAAQLFLSEKDADYVANFKEAFEAVREANLEEDEAIEEDVEYIKFVNGINDVIEKAMEKEEK
ncbi:MAG: SH3 domain-containing protein [Eubacteriales bacterium]|nr:SH3 domain-containing protein [Eubacteriales bacterium]